MKPELIIVSEQLGAVMADLAQDFTLHPLWEAEDEANFLADIGPNIRGVVTSGASGAKAAFMDQLPNLEIISSLGVGYDSIDVAHATTKDIIVTNTPEVLADGVAELGLALMLSTARRLAEGDRYVRAGRWPNEGDLPLGRSLGGRRLGIVGLGAIGAKLAKLCEAFDMKVAYYGPNEKPQYAYAYEPDLMKLAENSDFLMVCCKGGEETRNLVSAEVIEALGADGMLINIARGTVVDEEAMLNALRTGKLGFAGLDVFDKEPQVPAGFMELDNVVLLPHIGSASVETRKAMGDLVAKNIRAHFSGDTVPTPVN